MWEVLRHCEFRVKCCTGLSWEETDWTDCFGGMDRWGGRGGGAGEGSENVVLFMRNIFPPVSYFLSVTCEYTSFFFMS